jgi:glucose-1-phosphate adenylyltransferase
MCLNLIYLITTIKFTQDLVYHRLNLKNTIEKSLISEGCILNAKEIKQSVIGIRSSREGTVIQNCYVMGNDFIKVLMI